MDQQFVDSLTSRKSLSPREIPDSYLQSVCDIFEITDEQVVVVIQIDRPTKKIDDFGLEW